MNKKFLLVLFSVMSLQLVDGFAQCFWATQAGGIGEDYGYAIGTDSIGNVYSAGSFTGTADFDPSASSFILNSSGGRDIYLLKLDGQRNFIWAKKIGGVSDDEPRDLHVDKNGDLYVTGYFKSSSDFDPSNNNYNLNSSGLKDVFIAKYDSSGSIQWAFGFGGVADDEGNSVSIDGFGSLYLTGTFQGNVDFNPGTSNSNLISNGGTDVFVSKFKTNGFFESALRFGGTSDDVGRCVKADFNGNLLVAGFFQSSVDFNPGSSIQMGVSNGGYDCFISKFDSSGIMIWSNQFGGNQSEGINSMDIDNHGGIYCTGFFSSSTDFDPGPSVSLLTPFSGSVGYPDVFISKFNSAGNLKWVGGMGGNTVDVGSDLVCDQFGNAYLTGRFSGVCDFNPGSGTFNLTSPSLTAGLYTDAFICKIDSSGIFVWAKRIGGKQHDWGNGISLDVFGNIFSTGYFSGLSGFDPNATAFPVGYTMTSYGSYDAFISKIISNQISLQPQDLIVNLGSNAVFSVLSNPFANYQWQVKTGNSFSDLVNSVQFSGVNSSTLNVNNVSSLNNFQQFRCVVGSIGCSDTSDIATLTVNLNSSIYSIEQDSFAKIYPSPTKDNIRITTHFTNYPYDFILVDSSGKISKHGKIDSPDIELKLNGLKAGLYLLMISNKYTFRFALLDE